MAPQNDSDWYWAAPMNGPAEDRFIIENGQPALWARARVEIDAERRCRSMTIQRMGSKGTVQLEDILDMMLTVVPHYRVNHNRFVFEAAKIPVFAKFLREARSDLCNYVSNSVYPEHAMKPEKYNDQIMRRLGRIVSDTLGCDDEWFL